MKTILIAGGNSGIGLQSAREFLKRGHKVILLGRDQQKGNDALLSFGETNNRAFFFSVDLSTHEGVRVAAKKVLDSFEKIDVILHTTGVFIPNKDVRTKDGLNLIFAVNYLSRFHLTQLLLPALSKSNNGHVVMMISKVNPSVKIELDFFPELKPFSDKRFGDQISACNHHYAAYLKKTYPTLTTGVVNAGMVKTDILREAPLFMKIISKIVGPILFNSVDEAAHNPVEACLREDITTPVYWEKPGKFDKQIPIEVDSIITQKIINFSKKITHI